MPSASCGRCQCTWMLHRHSVFGSMPRDTLLAQYKSAVCAQVVAQGDGYWCEHDSKSYESMERRYVLRVQAADFTGESFLALFNDQAREHCQVASDNAYATSKRVARITKARTSSLAHNHHDLRQVNSDPGM